MITMSLTNRPKQEHKSQRTQGRHHQPTIPVAEVLQARPQMLTHSFDLQCYVPKIAMIKLWI